MGEGEGHDHGAAAATPSQRAHTLRAFARKKLRELVGWDGMSSPSQQVRAPRPLPGSCASPSASSPRTWGSHGRRTCRGVKVSEGGVKGESSVRLLCCMHCNTHSIGQPSTAGQAQLGGHTLYAQRTDVERPRRLRLQESPRAGGAHAYPVLGLRNCQPRRWLPCSRMMICAGRAAGRALERGPGWG